MKTTIWATCPKCQSELKIDTDETELVQIECPDCHKLFAAKVPPRRAAPVQDVFAQMPVLPPFQPAQVHYKSPPRSDGSMSPAVLTALIVVCASAILIPLGFGGYYIYGKLVESSQVALIETSKSTPLSNSQSNPAESDDSNPPVFIENPVAAQTTGTTTHILSGVVGSADSTTSANQNTFPVPELNPPAIIQPDASGTTDTINPNSASSLSTTSTPTQAQVTVAGAGISKSGLPVALHRFVGPSGVLIFILHSNSHSVANNIRDLQREFSVPETHADGGSGHTTLGIRYSGTVDSVVKGIRFGKVTYADEETRTIHVKVN